MGPETTAKPPRYGQSAALILVGLLWVAHVVMNWLWLRTNVTILGWDRPAHLVRSLQYLELLQPLSVGSLFDALTHPSFYPPLFHITSVGFYSLFGVSADSAALTNSIFLAILLVSVYGIGTQMYDTATGLLAACLVSLLPIVFFMARSTYIDFAMMALVALTVFLLLKSDRFRSRWWSYLLGVSLGLGLLAKWIFIVFAGPPCLYVFLTSPVIPDLKSIIANPGVRWRRLALSLVVGFGAAGLWYLLSGTWDAKATYGLPIALLYGLLLSVLAYTASVASRPFNNLAGAVAVAVGIAAIWYIPNSDFITTALYKAYHAGSETKGAWSAAGITGGWQYYIRGTVNEHLSAPITLIALMCCGAWLIARRRTRDLWPLSDNVWILGLWICVPFALFVSFSNSASWSMRFTISLLPAVAIVLAAACLKLRNKTIRRLAVAILLLFACVQWLVLSFDALAPLQERTGFKLPGWGDVNWFAKGEFVQWPNHGLTDSGYWLVPAVLDQVRLDSTSTSPEQSSAGLLANLPYLNGYHATYLAKTEYPDIELIDLFRNRGAMPVYPRLFGMDYVIVADDGIRSEAARDQSMRLVTAILADPPDDFSQAFSEIAAFQAPNGDVIRLYRNETYEPPHSIPAAVMPGSGDTVADINFGDELLLMSYRIHKEKLARTGRVPIVLYWLGLRDMDEDYVITLKLVNSVYQVWGQQQGRPAWDSFPTPKWAKGEVVADEREIPLLPGTPPGSYLIEVVIRGVHEKRELTPIEGQGRIVGEVHIPRQTHLSPEQLDVENPLQEEFGGKISLLGYNIESGFRPGDNIHLTLFWQATREMDESYTVFCHLVGPDGQLWGQQDDPPAAGFYPTDSWVEGEIVRDQHDMAISPEAPVGAYRLLVGLYDSESGQRVPVTQDGKDAGQDSVPLGGVTVEP